MAYLGNGPGEAYTNTVKDSFNGDGSTTAFTMSVPSSTNDVRVVVENVIQDPTVAYSCAGTTLTFTSAPPSGTANIYVIHLGLAVMTTVPPSEISDATVFSSNVTVQGAFTSQGIDDNANATAITIDSSENVGIGDTSPSRALSTKSSSVTVGSFESTSASGGLISFVDPNTTNDVIVRIGSLGNNLVLQAGGSERMRIESGGNVGIGTTSPSSFNTTGGKFVVAGGTVQALFSDAANYTLGIKHQGSGAVGMFGGTAGSSLALMSDNTERMRIDSSGNVGIGTTSVTSDAGWTPSLVLAETSAYPALILKGQTSQQNSIGASNGLYLDSLGSSTGSNNRIIFRVTSSNNTFSATEAMRIDNSGNVLINKTSFNNDVGCAFNQNGVGYFVAGGGSVPLLVNSITSNSTQTLVQFYRNSTGVGSISYSTTNGTAYNTSSDYRLKTDVQPMVGASARVQALNPVNFEWVSNGTRVDGFLAHEAQAVVPEAVTGEKDAMMDEGYEVTPAVYEDVVIGAVEEVLDEDGNVLTESQPERTEQNLVTEAVMGTRSVPDMQGIDQSKLVPSLTAALQEALTKIDSLETRLTALEG